MTDSRKISRRRLLGQTVGAALAGAALAGCRPDESAVPPQPKKPSPQAVKTASAPNNEISVGIIGCGRRNGQLAIGKGGQGEPPQNMRIIAVADVNVRRADAWAKYHKCQGYQDYRKLLDRQDVKVVVYATPEHWHYLPCIHACQAGKDIYGEQPLSHTIREGRVMVEAVRKYKRVFQTGEQQRSHPKTRKAVELILNGRIGKLQQIIGYNYPSPFECGLPGPAGARLSGLGSLVRAERGGALPYGTLPVADSLRTGANLSRGTGGEVRLGARLDVVPALLGR